MASSNPVQVEKYLKGMDYPADKKELLECAKRNGADQGTCDRIQHLPDQRYAKPTDVTKALSASGQSRGETAR